MYFARAEHICVLGAHLRAKVLLPAHTKPASSILFNTTVPLEVAKLSNRKTLQSCNSTFEMSLPAQSLLFGTARSHGGDIMTFVSDGKGLAQAAIG